MVRATWMYSGAFLNEVSSRITDFSNFKFTKTQSDLKNTEGHKTIKCKNRYFESTKFKAINKSFHRKYRYLIENIFNKVFPLLS